MAKIIKNTSILIPTTCLALLLAACSGTSTELISNDSSNEDSISESSSSETTSTSTSSTSEGGGPGGGPGGGGSGPGGGSDPAGGGGTPGGGGSSSSVEYSYVNSYTSDATISNTSLSSTGTDENIVYIDNGATVEFDTVDFTRTNNSSTGGDNASFYGVGASILNYDGTAYIDNSIITSDAKGGAGVFSYGDSVTYVDNTTINTSLDTSGGIHAAGGGTLYAWDLTVETDGGSSAAIRSDRGGGTMVVDGGSYTSNGSGSPAIYCTADIAVNDATLVATGSEGICIEGLNTLAIYDSNLTSNMPDDSQNDTTWSVTLYQSQSGDSEIGESLFRMSGGSITSNNGGLFYTTNTESSFVLNNVQLNPASDSEFLLQCTGNNNSRGWGSSGSNGATSNFTGINQTMTGDVIWDEISELDFYLTSSSKLTGAFIHTTEFEGSGSGGYSSLYIDSSSTWIVDGNSEVTNLYNAGTICDSSGRTVTITDGSTTYVSGTSAYTITVNTYSTSASTSGAGSIGSFSDYAVTKPTQLS